MGRWGVLLGSINILSNWNTALNSRQKVTLSKQSWVSVVQPITTVLAPVSSARASVKLLKLFSRTEIPLWAHARLQTFSSPSVRFPGEISNSSGCTFSKVQLPRWRSDPSDFLGYFYSHQDYYKKAFSALVSHLVAVLEAMESHWEQRVSVQVRFGFGKKHGGCSIYGNR